MLHPLSLRPGRISSGNPPESGMITDGLYCSLSLGGVDCVPARGKRLETDPNGAGQA